MYYEEMNQLIRQCIENSRAHPFNQYLFIVEDKAFVERMFFKHTHYLINVRIMTWNQFLSNQIIVNHLTHRKCFTDVELFYYIRQIIIENKNLKVFNKLSYPLINEIISLLKELELNNTFYSINHDKLNDFMIIYNELKKYNRFLTQEDILKEIIFTHQYEEIYIETTNLQESLRKTIINHLSINNKVIEYRNNYSLDIKGKVKEVVSTHSEQEVDRVIYHILEDIQKYNTRYKDHIIVYPDQTYKELLIKHLNKLNIPHDLEVISSCKYDLTYKRIIDKLEEEAYLKVNQYEALLHDIMIADKRYGSLYMDYFNQLRDFEAYMDHNEFKDFFMYTYRKDHVEVNDMDDVIHCIAIENLRSIESQSIYILGMNEDILPRSIKDTSLLLDEDIMMLRAKGIETPETTLEKRNRLNNNIYRSLQAPCKEMILSYSNSTLSGDPLLKSGLYNKISLYAIDQLKENDYLSDEEIYLLNKDLSSYSVLNNHIKHYKASRNEPDHLSEEMVNKLYSPLLSVSQIETYNKCPYLYFIKYGLKIEKMDDESFTLAEIGSLVHYILEKEMKKDEHLKEVIRQEVIDYINDNPYLSSKYEKKINQYVIDNVIENLPITIQVASHIEDDIDFKVNRLEEKVEGHLGALRFVGIVDRIDTYDDLINIIDYKSSSKDVDLDLARQGFNIQMLLYMKMVKENRIMKPGGVLYFNTKRRVINVSYKENASLNDEMTPKKLYDAYKYNGFIIDKGDHRVIHALNEDKYIKVRYVKKSESYKGNIISMEEYDQLIEDIENHISEINLQRINGSIDIAPKDSEDSNIHYIVNPCRYCDYKSVCHFDYFYNESINVEKEADNEV